MKKKSKEPKYGWQETPRDLKRCIEAVHERGRGIGFYQCHRKKGFGPNKDYCRQHPKRVKELADKKWKAYKERMKVLDRQAEDRIVGARLRENNELAYKRVLAGKKFKWSIEVFK